jgi:hypothetical protein
MDRAGRSLRPPEVWMRALYPYDAAMVERNGISVGYEVFGAGSPTIVLLASWAIVHARQWKAQVPFLARQFRVVTVEGRETAAPTGPGGPRTIPIARTSTTRSQ